MTFAVRMGVPHMKKLYEELRTKKEAGTLSTDEEQLFKKLVWVTLRLESNPRHPGLHSHEIDDLSKKFSKGRKKKYKVWQSYLENNTPGAGRIYWVYGSEQHDITIIGLEPHPEDKKHGAYERITLSDFSATGEMTGESRLSKPFKPTQLKGGKKRKK